MSEHFAPEFAPDHDDAQVEAAQAPVRRADPLARPADAALPLARGVDEEDRHHAAHQGKFLRGLDNPVHAAAEARAIFARAEEQGVEECGVPDGEEK